MSEEAKPTKKILEDSVGGNLAVPIAIVLVAALIIFGVTKMISTERSYKDLVREMHSKTFGNRWVAAYELSKLISSKKIPEEDIPWLVDNLKDVYDSSQEERTKEFLVVALGSLGRPEVLPILMDALKNGDEKTKFHVLASLGNFTEATETVDWSQVLPFLKSSDEGLVQASMFALATHKVPSAEKELLGYLNSEKVNLRFSAATALVNYRNDEAIPVLKQIMLLEALKGAAANYSVEQVGQLKINVLRAVDRVSWKKLNSFIEEASKKEKDVKVVSKAREVLNRLKN